MDFKDVVAGRRMVRHFADEPVDRSVLERIAAVAQRAPSAGFSQGQRLLIVTDPASRRRIAELSFEPHMVEQGFDRWLTECAAIFVPLVSEQVYHRRYQEPDKLEPGGEEIDWPVPYWWMDIGCTVMLVLLAAVDEGLAAGFAGAEADGIAAFKREFGVPDEFVPVGFIPVGRPLPDKRSPSLARGWVPTQEFARWERW
jgi:FMN reductase [NAD(P)H]